MQLPVQPIKYDQQVEVRRNFVLGQADDQNRKSNSDLIVGKTQKLIIYSPNGTRYQIVVSNAGALSASAL
jgi:hypothetical protein